MSDKLHKRSVEYFRALQDRICMELEAFDGTMFHEDYWEYEAAGGGRSRVIAEGKVFEKAGVNFSNVSGEFSEEMAKQIPGDGRQFTATGISLVLHPRNPHIPTVHANFRYLTKGERAWFGGGADLTPYVLVHEDCIHFHTVWKDVCERHSGVVSYPRLKKWCDDYFHLPHRGECRGVGGIFFDYLEDDLEATFEFVKAAGDHFLESYLPIAQLHVDDDYTPQQRQYQLYRRGRYVEFNLVYDRGTVFGLKTGGRIESILMSLPPLVSWVYDWKPQPGSPEAKLQEVLRNPIDWVDP